jgi:hypothetical protein
MAEGVRRVYAKIDDVKVPEGVPPGGEFEVTLAGTKSRSTGEQGGVVCQNRAAPVKLMSNSTETARQNHTALEPPLSKLSLLPGPYTS